MRSYPFYASLAGATSGFLPVVGDLVSDPYFAARSVASCVVGSCDAFNLGTDVGSLFLPGGSLSSLRRAGSVGLGLATGIAKAGNRAEDILDASRGLHGFSAGNFRQNLEGLTDMARGSAYQAHHVFPQKFFKRFETLRGGGIDIHDPHFGAWFNSHEHAVTSYAYNMEWQNFFERTPGPSRSQVLDFGRDLSRKYGFEIYF